MDSWLTIPPPRFDPLPDSGKILACHYKSRRILFSDSKYVGALKESDQVAKISSNNNVVF